MRGGIGAVLGVFLLAGHVLAAPSPLHVTGNRLEDSQGHTVRLQGVNVPSLEWSDRGDNILRSVRVAQDNWQADILRVPLCQDRWFGKAAGQTGGGAVYRMLVDDIVQSVSARNKYVLLDLHWSDGGRWDEHIGQHCMPDDNSVLFWKSVAARYANNPAVLFDLYNEPHDISWDVWRDGGDVDERNQDPQRGLHLTYHTPGMQALLETVRQAGAKNVVVAGGVDWAYDLTGIVDGHALSDTEGDGVMYATHIYPWKTDWDKHVTPAAAQYAVFVGEVGCAPSPPDAPKWQQVDPQTWAPRVLAYINQHQFSWTAWSFHPSASPCLIQGWDYAPTVYWGRYVQAALRAQPQNVSEKKETKRL